MVELADYQIDAVEKLRNGSVLCGGVGSGKSRTSLAYYIFYVCNGLLPINGEGKIAPMKTPKDLYIITTAKKRDSHEWEDECAKFLIGENDKGENFWGTKLTIDSWNNIKKYREVKDAFFIFDEQRVVGYGTWSKSFIKITKSNEWILASATPGDQWTDYMPVFIANGFFKNKTDFTTRHIQYARFSKYPKIEKYVDERHLRRLRDSILVTMEDQRRTTRHTKYIHVEHNKLLYKRVFKDRWDVYDNCPIEETGKLFYLLRKVVNSDETRLSAVSDLIDQHDRSIIFYNFNYELEDLKLLCDEMKIKYAEWNGNRHEPLPLGDRWVYLVQYAAGCEGWNCVTSDTIIFYSQSYSYRMTEQAAGRIDRMNTPFKDLYYYILISSAPIDLAIKRALSRKENFNEKRFLQKVA